MNRIVSSHVKDMSIDDNIFSINFKAKEKEEEIGKENVINATIGVLIDENGLVCFDTVKDVFNNLEKEEIAAYTPMKGTPEYRKGILEYVLKDKSTARYASAIATVAGSLALRHSFYYYCEPGDSILVPDWYWGPYDNIASQNERNLHTFNMFKDNKLDIDDFKKQLVSLLEKQKRVLTVLNFPANNPTGYCPEQNEYKKIYDIISELSREYNDKAIILLFDIAYIDYVKEEYNPRGFLSYLKDLPNNVFTLLSYSLSKSFTLYGTRTGALIGLSNSKEVIEEFETTIDLGNRGTVSCISRPASSTFTKIYDNKDLLKKVENERKKYIDLLYSRADAFIKSAKEVGLKHLEYKGGFFISIKCKDKNVAEKLMEKGVFLVPEKNGLRIAICSVTEEKLSILAKIIKEVIK